MQRFAHPNDNQNRPPAEARAYNIDALLEENDKLKGLVIYLSALVVRNISERTKEGTSVCGFRSPPK
jgi:hypothetical protein